MSNPTEEHIVPENVENPTPQAKAEFEIPEEKIKEIQTKAFGHVLNMIDQKMAEAGYEKPEGVKTTEFILEVLNKSKKVSEEGTNEPKKEVNEETATKIKALQDKLTEREKELEQVKTSTATQKRDYFVDTSVNNFEIDVPAGLSEAEASRYVERNRKLIKNELLATYDFKEVNGEFRALTKEGISVFDDTIDMNPIKISDLIKRDFSEFSVRTKAPAPVKGTGGVEPTKQKFADVEIPSSVKSATELHEYLTKTKGYVLGDSNYMKVVMASRELKPTWYK